MTHDGHKLRRCAIYTRKSTEEGLAQSFNSLHAQREACEAYISSLKGEGWVASKARYDDGGFSGGNMKRPALSRLLSDVDAGKIDAVVVYKVDRLTRSLVDFARIVERFDSRGVAFVSVTQGFNSANATGKLTLNILLSFAQFERDVTGERIRDKIAASKAKGMWMGGHVPLGYQRPKDGSRTLEVHPIDARAVTMIFTRFLMIQSLSGLRAALQADGISPRPGRVGPLAKFSTGALRYLLANRIYLGEIVHKGQAYPGRHHAIIDTVTFEATQAILAANSSRRRSHVSHADRTLLRWLVFDRDGQPMAPIITRGGGKRYHYYASGSVVCADAVDDAIRRVRGAALDDLVSRLVGRLLDHQEPADRGEVRSLVKRVEIHATTVEVVIDLRAFAVELASRQPYQDLRRRLDPAQQLIADAHFADRARVVLPVRLVAWGGRKWTTPPSKPSNHLQLQLLAKLRAAHSELADCGLDPDAPLNKLYRVGRPRSGGSNARLALLAPDIQKAILDGESFPGAEALLAGSARVPASWAAQRMLLWNEPIRIGQN